MVCTYFWRTVFKFSLPFVVGRKKESSSRVQENEEGRGKRDAIRLHEVYTLETVVVADSDMVQYHGGEAAQRFLLTVMNMVRFLESNAVFDFPHLSLSQTETVYSNTYKCLFKYRD